MFRRLFLFVEGESDRRFVERILVPRLSGSCDELRVVEYAQLTTAKVDGYLRSIGSMGGQYVFLADLDHSECATRRIEQLRCRYRSIEKARVIVVCAEIESWYVAGVDAASAPVLGLDCELMTELVTKEKLAQWCGKGCRSRTEVLLKILSRYSVSSARRRSRSFDFAMRRLGLE